MAGTLTNSAAATSFRFHNVDRLTTASSIESISNLYIAGRNRKTPKASLHAIIDQPLVESAKMKSMSLYDVLNLKRNATASEIKSAYRSLAKRYHPDATHANQNDDRDFIGIRNAYVTLSDPTARALYDLKFERRSGGMYTAAGKSSGFYAGRRWETDQCW